MSQKHLSNPNPTVKVVTDTVEVGELKTTFSIGCNGVRHSYSIILGYSFSYTNKGGELGNFAIQKEGHEEKYECDGVFENIDYTVNPLFRTDFPTANEDQMSDMQSEITDMVADLAQSHHLKYFTTAYDKQQHIDSLSE